MCVCVCPALQEMFLDLLFRRMQNIYVWKPTQRPVVRVSHPSHEEPADGPRTGPLPFLKKSKLQPTRALPLWPCANRCGVRGIHVRVFTPWFGRCEGSCRSGCWFGTRCGSGSTSPIARHAGAGRKEQQRYA